MKRYLPVCLIALSAFVFMFIGSSELVGRADRTTRANSESAIASGFDKNDEPQLYTFATQPGLLSPLTSSTTLTGDVFPPPLGVNFVTGDPGNTGLIGRASGNMWYFSGIALPSVCGDTTYWGPSNGRVRLSFVSSGFPNPGEVLTFQSGLSNLPGGIAVWTGQTFIFGSGSPVFTRFTMTVNSHSGGVPGTTGAAIALTNPTTVGLAANVGALVPVTPGIDYRVNMRFDASFTNGSGYQPALDFYDAQTTAGGTAFESFLAGFYYYNTFPTLSHIGNQTTNINVAVGPIPFSVGDCETSTSSLVMSGTSSNTTLVPNANIAFGGSGPVRNITITPAAGQSGTTTITYAVLDGIDTTNDSFVLTVNAPPTIAAATGLSRQQGSPVSNSQIATVTDDGGNGSVSVTVSSPNPSNGVTISNIVNTGGNITADIVADCTATTATFTLQASDGSLTATDMLTVTVTSNTAPTLVYSSPQSVSFGGAVNVTPTSASDNGTITDYAVQSGHGLTTAPTVDASGVVSITNAQPAGAHTITIRATDNCAVTTDATFTLDVAPQPPTLGTYPDTTVALGANSTVTPDATPTNATSINVYSSTNFKGTFSADPATGVVRVTNAHPAGTHTVTVTAFNGSVVNTTKTFTLTVQAGTACTGASVFSNAADSSMGAAPVSVAIGDFNNDGKQDLAAANNNSNTVSIRLGDGAGGFTGTTNVSVGTLPFSVAIGDFNGDGKQDIAVANAGSNAVSIRLGDGAGGFSGTTEVSMGSYPYSIAIGDFNNDGKQDIAAANQLSDTVSIRLGNGAGGFNGTTEVGVGSRPFSIAIGDFNNDSKQDFAVAHEGSNGVSIRLGDGAGGFSGTTEVSVGSAPYSVAIGDFNNDGKQDIAAANSALNTVSIRLGDGLGGFSGTTNISVGDAPYSVAIGDFNNDGKQDLAAANFDSDTVSIRLGDGSGGFSGTTNVSVGSEPFSVAIGDFNGDGKQDIAAANSNHVSIRLGACNFPPTISDVPNQLTQRNQATAAINITIGDVDDLTGNSLNMSGNSSNTTLVPNANIVFAGSGNNRTVTITPANNQTGTTTITVTVADAFGATASDTFDLRVNAPPVFGTNTGLTLNQGATATITNSMMNVTDADNTPAQLRYTIASSPNGGPPHQGTLKLNTVALTSGSFFTQDDVNNNRLTYAHDDSNNTSDDFQFNITDGDGATLPNDGVHVSFSFSISIMLINHAPVAVNGNGTTGIGAPFNGMFDATDRDLPAQTLTRRIVTNGTKGVAVLNNATTGAFTYTPNSGQSGTDTIIFQVNDGSLDSVSPGTFTITIQNQPPTVQNGSGSTNEGIALSSTLTGADPDQPPQPLTFAIVNNPTKGNVNITNTATGAFTYTPNANAIGADSFTFTASDGLITSAPGTFSINIHPNFDAGDIFVTNSASTMSGQVGSVIQIDPSNGMQSLVTTGGNLTNPSAIIIEHDGNLVVINNNNSVFRLVRINPATGAQSLIPSGPSFGNPVGLGIGPGADIFVADPFAHCVFEVNPTTGAQVHLFSGGNLGAPAGLAFDSNGNLLVSDAAGLFGGSSKIVRINTTTDAQTVVSTGGNLLLPVDIALDSNGDIIVSDAPNIFGPGTGNLIRVNATSGAQTLITGTGLGKPSGVAVDQSNNNSLTPDNSGPTVLKTTPGGTTTTMATGEFLSQPFGIVMVRCEPNDAPVSVPGGPYTADLGSGVTLSGSGSSDPDSSCGDSIVNYSWTIGGAVSVTGVAPSLTAAQVDSLGVGSHTVSLTVTDALGLTGTASTTLTVYDNRPFASFTANPNPAACSQSVSFNAGASSHGRPDRSIVSYAWTFGDGATGSGVMVSHAYSHYGNYIATLTVTDNNVPAKTAIASTTVNVNQGNQAPVSVPGGPYAADLGSGITLNGTGSSDPNAGCGDSIVSYSWNIDSGAVMLSGASPSLSAAQVNALGLGSHPVMLTVTDTFGLPGSASTTLSIYDNRPFASFTASPNPAACNQAVSFNGSGSTHGRPDRSIVSYAWNFGDGQTGTGISVNHTYNHFGVFNATVTVTDNNVPAKTDFVTHSISVNQGNQAPIAVTGGPYAAYQGSGITLNGSGSSDPDASCGDSIVSYSWSIDSGAVMLNGVMPSLSAAQINALGVGVHSVQLTVRDSFAAPGTSSTTLTINSVATLGNYPNTSVALSGNTTVTPDAAPTNTTSINVSTSTNFKGKLEGEATTGVVRVTDAHPAGLYTITVTAFASSGLTTTKTFGLTVTTPATCNPVSFAAAANFGVDNGPVSVAVGDFNRDGKQDLAVADNGASNVSILLGDGAGSFSAATNFGAGTGPRSVAVGDFNGDGKQDLAVAAGSGNVSILLGNGAGSFSAATNFGVGLDPDSVAVGDFNGDGRQDLAVANSSSDNVSILLGDGAGSFSAATNFGVEDNPQSVAVGDFNGDSKQDFAVANFGSSTVSILLGDGVGSFSVATNFGVGTNPLSVTVGDFNGDSKQDLAVANINSNNVSILLGDGAGGFSAATNFGVGTNPLSVAVGDFNGDGKQDLATANRFSNNASILLGDGAGGFSAAANFGVGTNPFSVAVGDFNGDGKQDLAVANLSSNNVSVLLRQCQPTLSINSTSTQTEGDSGQANMTFTVTLSSSSSQVVTVNYSTANGSVNPALGGATCGGMVDYVTTSGTLTFNPGDTTKTIDVPICGDTTDEPDETFTVTLETPVNSTIASGTSTATIIDNDAMPAINVGDFTQNEGNSGTTAFNFLVTLSNPSQGTITVDFTTQNNSAAQPSDYTLNTGTLNFSPGETQKMITVQVNGDTTFEPNETFFVNLMNNSSNAGISDGQGLGTINNDDAAPTFSIDDVSHNEGNAGTTSYTFTVTKSGSTALNSQVDFTTVNGSATIADNDYQTQSGTTFFLPADTTKQITVLVNGDTTFEPNEAFTVHLFNATGATISDADGTGTINNDDPNPPALGNYPNTSVALSGNTTVTPDAAPTNTTSINVSTSTSFKGKLEGDATTGVVRVTDAHPAGLYTITVKAFGSGGLTTTKTFALTVTTPATCNPVSFAAATNFGAGTNPFSVAVGDFNGDGKQDLAVANALSQHVSILLGDGAGSFSAPTDFGVLNDPESVAVGDFNGDGKQDLAVAEYSGNNAAILLGDGAGSFSAATHFGVGTHPDSVAVGDFNGDGKQDLAVANENDNNVSVLLGNGAGSFSAASNPVVGNQPASVAVGDFNGDGKQDLAVANANSSNVSILLGNGAGSFGAATNFGVGGVALSVAVGDFNGDGKQDLAVANAGSGSAAILLGNGAGSFSAATNFGVGTNPRSVVVGDFNGDGKQDLAAANGGSNNVSILLGDGAGSFTAVPNLAVGTNPRSVAVGDFNGDGQQDLVVPNQNSNNVSVLMRQCQPTLSINSTSTQTEGDSGQANMTFTVTLSSSSSQSVTVHYSTANGSVNPALGGATCGDMVDYVTTGGTLTFNPGDTTKTIDVPICGDTTDEPDETFTVTLDTPVNSTIAWGTSTATITDNDPMPAINVGDFTQNEGNSGTTSFNFLVTLSNPSQATITVDFTTQNNSATQPSDYTLNTGTLNFSPGETQKTITVQVNGDITFESNETFFVNLMNSSSNAAISDGQGLGTINNDDAAPTFAIDDVSHNEGNIGTTSYTFTVTKSGSTALNASVDFGTVDGSALISDNDYQTLSGTLTFLPADTTKQITVLVNGDSKLEPTETFTVHLSGAVGATIADDVGIGNIGNDDPPPTFSIDDVSHNEGNAGTTAYTFTVTKTGETIINASVDFIVVDGTATSADGDYQIQSGTLNFQAEDTTKQITVLVNGDTKFESNEAFTVHLSNPSQATIADADGAGTITNDDSAPTFTIDDVTHNEGNVGTTSYTFTVSKTGSTALNSSVNFTTVDGTAKTSDNDYQIQSGTLSFLPADTTKTITILVNGDTTFEANESFSVHLSGATGATISDADGAGTITNDDSMPTLAIDDVTHNEGDSGTTVFTFTVTKTGNTAIDFSVNFATVDGTATIANNDYQTNSGTLNFLAADTTKQITVLVNGDTAVEPDEAFTVHLSNASNATISDADGAGAVINDDCSFSLSSNNQNFTAAGGNGSVTVTTTNACAWTAVSNDAFVTVNSGAPGLGNGTVNYSVAVNTGPARTGTMTIAGQTFTVTQDSGCTFTLSRDHQSFPGAGGNGSVNVTAPDPGCAWMASTAATFIHITSGSSGTGNGTVQYTVDANASTTIRSNTITIAGHTYTVYQGIDFLDVPPSHDFYAEIGKLAARGVTLGCNPVGPMYCPSNPVLREQMAAFLMRALGEFNPPPPAMQRFGDVPPSNDFYAFIERLAQLGITLGCQPGMPPLYCPTDPVKREQMSAFILRALGEFNPPMPLSQRFGDVPPSNDFYNFIDRLAVLQITQGCQPGNPPLFCPNDNVTRGQMAAFLVRAFDL